MIGTCDVLSKRIRMETFVVLIVRARECSFLSLFFFFRSFSGYFCWPFGHKRAHNVRAVPFLHRTRPAPDAPWHRSKTKLQRRGPLNFDAASLIELRCRRTPLFSSARGALNFSGSLLSPRKRLSRNRTSFRLMANSCVPVPRRSRRAVIMHR